MLFGGAGMYGCLCRFTEARPGLQVNEIREGRCQTYGRQALIPSRLWRKLAASPMEPLMFTRIGLVPIACAALGAALAAGCGGKSGPEPAEPGQPRPGPGAVGPDTQAPAGSSLQAAPLRLDDAVRPLRYAAELHLDPRADTFDGQIAIDIEVAEDRARIWLNAAEIDVTSASLVRGSDTWKVDVVRSQAPDVIYLELGRTLAPGPASLRLAYRGRLSAKESSGAFKQKDREDWYIYTQFEPLGARRAFPCFDEPRFKVPWELTIHAPQDLVVVSNMPVAGETAGPRPGTRSHRFAPTPPLPSYLIAFAVGAFETVDLGPIGRGKVPARIVMPRGHTGEARYAAEVTPRLLALLEDYVDAPYPYAKLDSIAVPYFGGAMENPGLITYGQSRILAPPAQETLQFRRDYAGLALHELAHMWFGNLVTMAWWDDLWLNESFATWMAARLLTKLEPAWEAEALAVRRTDQAILLDSLTSARRIREPIESSNDIFSAFDDITYRKGSAVLTMFERWLGPERFRAGVHAYLRAHAHGTATGEDFVAALVGASQPEAGAAMRTFLDQTGVPVISADLVCEPGEPPMVELAQEWFLPAGSAGSSTDRTWSVPVCVKHGSGPGNVREQCMLLTEEADTMVLEGPRRCPAWLLANAGASGYYRAVYDVEMQGRLLGAARRQLSMAERVKLASDIQGMIRAGNLELGEALALVPALLADPSDQVALAAVELVAGMRAHLVPAALTESYRRFVRDTFGARARKLGWQTGKNDSLATRTLRAELLGLVAIEGGEPALVEQARRMADTWLEQHSGAQATTQATVDPEILETVLAAASVHGDADFHARLESALRATDERHQRKAILNGLAHAREPARVRASLALIATGVVDLRESAVLVTVPLKVPEIRDVVDQVIRDNYDAIVARVPREALSRLIEASAAHCDQGHLDQLDAFFGPRAAAIEGGPRALAETREHIQLCMAARSLQQPSVEAFLKKR
jgi:cytosol alanyl aminopeptidase